MTKKINLAILLIIIASSTFAQKFITGKILDQETSKPIQSVNIKVEGMSDGGISSADGTFNISTTENNVSINFSYVGYKQLNLFLKDVKAQNDIGTITLQSLPYSIDEIIINAGLKNETNMPVSVSVISAKAIESKLGDRPLPLILQTIPGIFSVRNGGGSGDAELSIRGFKQEDITLMLNGIPINGQENGLVYWSNWLGLSNTAAEIQVQKGPGLANASVSGVGGSVNIITRNAQKQKSGSVNFDVTNFGNFNTTISLNSGELSNGWNTSLMLSLGSGSGYIDATYVRSMSYFFTADKKINDRHKLTITLLGAPERHGQRTLLLSNSEVNNNGLRYNKDWGGFVGGIKNASENFYHKPFLSVNHDFKINNNNLLSTSIYFSVGYGGGRWSESFNYAPSIFTYRDNAGQIDWDNIYENNAYHEGIYILDNRQEVSGYSMNIQTNFLASHIQTGIMSNFEYKFNNKLSIISGIHYRYLNSFVREEIDNLLGGQFFIEDYSWSVSGVAGRDQIKSVGDIIHVDNNSIINFANIFSQMNYNSGKVRVYFSVNANSNWYQRIDRFNYISDNKSEIIEKSGVDLRAGYLYNINEFQSVYLNAAAISKAPYFKYVFGNYTNIVVHDQKNENTITVEFGYSLRWKNISSNLNLYTTNRTNVSMLTNEYIQLEDNTQTRAMVVGLEALNKGVEFETIWEINRNLKIGGWMAIGDFRWQNDINATLINDNNVVVDTINVYAKGLYIGGTAQKQFGVFANLNLLQTIYLKTEYLYNGGLYANFNPTQRSNPDDLSQPFQLPSYGIVNVYIGIPFSINNHYGNLQINTYNLFNKKYIVVGEDGIDHNLDTFRGFWSFGRNLSFSLKFNF